MIKAKPDIKSYKKDPNEFLEGGRRIRLYQNLLLLESSQKSKKLRLT